MLRNILNNLHIPCYQTLWQIWHTFLSCDGSCVNYGIALKKWGFLLAQNYYLISTNDLYASGRSEALVMTYLHTSTFFWWLYFHFLNSLDGEHFEIAVMFEIQTPCTHWHMMVYLCAKFGLNSSSGFRVVVLKRRRLKEELKKSKTICSTNFVAGKF